MSITFCANCDKAVEIHGSWTSGHNGQPLVNGRVCDSCNGLVIAMRLRYAAQMALARREWSQ